MDPLTVIVCHICVLTSGGCILIILTFEYFYVYENKTVGQGGPKHVAEITDEDGYLNYKVAFHYQYRTLPQIYSSASCSITYLP